MMYLLMKKFYEVAKFCGADLVTGNLKHYPADPRVMNVTAFLEKAKRELADFR